MAKTEIITSLRLLEGKIQHYLRDLSFKDAVALFPKWKFAGQNDHPATDPLSFHPETSGSPEKDYRDKDYLTNLHHFFNIYLVEFAPEAKTKGHKHYELYEMLASAVDLTNQLLK